MVDVVSTDQCSCKFRNNRVRCQIFVFPPVAPMVPHMDFHSLDQSPERGRNVPTHWKRAAIGWDAVTLVDPEDEGVVGEEHFHDLMRGLSIEQTERAHVRQLSLPCYA